MIITYTFESLREHDGNKDYIPPEDESKLRIMQEAKLAVLSSHALIEQYWTIWSQQYLKSLRESHKVNINNKRGTPRVPTVNTVILIHEPLQPRNTWKMDRIIKLQQSESGVIREAEIRLSNQKFIRRPVNLLIPLEIGEQQAPDTEGNATNTPNEGSKEAERNYTSLQPPTKNTV
uniref:DUF5641 domain-containing protein n=1 Tax=Angiostrongylus cantonensis TaxID=6313 RepID=A0A0K0DQK4_ANGCA